MNYKKLFADAIVPTQGSEGAAGKDFYAYIKPELYEEKLRYQYNYKPALWIPAHETVLVHTGFAFEVPEGYFMDLRPRSGIASRKGLRPANTPGTIDCDYRGEVMVALHNDHDKYEFIVDGERIAQYILVAFLKHDLNEVDELSPTVRGDGGFGSSGE